MEQLCTRGWRLIQSVSQASAESTEEVQEQRRAFTSSTKTYRPRDPATTIEECYPNGTGAFVGSFISFGGYLISESDIGQSITVLINQPT
jgi:hypothetical protein